MMVTIAVAVQFFIRAEMVQDSFNKLLQFEDYTTHEKMMTRKIGQVIWVVAGLLFAALNFALRAWVDRQGE